MSYSPIIVNHTTPMQLAALLQRCNLYISNDTGPMHLSTAVKTPTVALFGASNLIQWSPPWDKHAVVARQACPFMKTLSAREWDTHTDRARENFAVITPDAVMATVEETRMVKSERDQMEALDVQRIINCLTDIRSRMYRQALLETVALTFFCGLILLAILFFLNRLVPLPMGTSSISWIVMSLAAIVGACFSIKHRKELLFVAQAVDEKTELRSDSVRRFGLIQDTPQGEFAQFQIRDAAETVTTLDIEK